MLTAPEKRSDAEADVIETLKDQARMLAAMARATAAAHDEVLELRRALAQAQPLEEPARALAELRQRCAALELECERLQTLADRQQARADRSDSRYLALSTSTSWRLTAPLRRAVSALRAVFGARH